MGGFFEEFQKTLNFVLQDVLKALSLQTFWGQAWYFNTFVMRYFVIRHAAGDIYDGELSEFKFFGFFRNYCGFLSFFGTCSN